MNYHRLIDHTLDFRRKSIEKLYSLTKRFINLTVDVHKDKISNNFEANEKYLRSEYGGPQFHLKSYDLVIEKRRYGYIDMNNNCLVTQQSRSLNNSMLNNSMEEPERIFLSQINQPVNEPPKPKLWGRYCDHRCQIPALWATHLFTNLRLLEPIANFKLLQNNIVSFETCSLCNASYTFKCDSIDTCNDNIRILNDLSSHFQRIRTITRMLYTIRTLNILLINIDTYLINGNIAEIIQCTDFEKELGCRMSTLQPRTFSTSQPLIDYDMITRFRKTLKTEMENKLSSYECLACHRLLTNDKVKKATRFELINPIIQRLCTEIEGNDYYICKAQCYDDVFNQDREPIILK